MCEMVLVADDPRFSGLRFLCVRCGQLRHPGAIEYWAWSRSERGHFRHGAVIFLEPWEDG